MNNHIMPTRHPRANTRLKHRYFLKNGVTIEVSKNMAWDCPFVELFHPESGRHEHFMFQRPRREMFKHIRVRMAMLINPDVERVYKRLNADIDVSFNEMLKQYIPAQMIAQQMQASNSLLSHIHNGSSQWQGRTMSIPLGIGKSGNINIMTGISGQQAAQAQRAHGLMQQAAALQQQAQHLSNLQAQLGQQKIFVPRDHILDAALYGMGMTGIKVMGIDNDTPKTEKVSWAKRIKGWFK